MEVQDIKKKTKKQTKTTHKKTTSENVLMTVNYDKKTQWPLVLQNMHYTYIQGPQSQV